MRKKHEWQSLHRPAHEPECMTLNDLFEEVRCAVSSNQDVTDLACLLDAGNYAAFGTRVAMMLKIMGGRPANKIAGRRKDIGGAS